MKKVLIAICFCFTMFMLNSCGTLSNDTYYRIGYDIGRSLFSENTLEEESLEVGGQNNALVEENL